MATDETKEQKVYRLIVDHLGIESCQATPGAHLKDNLAADSLDIVELVMVMEEEFRIEITDEETEALGEAKIKDWVALIEKKEPALASA